MDSYEESSFLILGLARDCASQLRQSIAHLQSAFSGAKSTHFLIVESDSNDNTSEVLRELADEHQNLTYKCLGNLADKLPLRTQRIAHCRNVCLEVIKAMGLDNLYNFTVVADLDGANDILTNEAVRSCWSRSDWDVCTANQAGPYYDIWALRHKVWCPNDCWEQAEFLMKHRQTLYCSTQSSVYSKMIRIKPNAPWIEVDSSFGGLGIYKTSLLKEVTYCGLRADGGMVCEHVSAHSKIRSLGGKIFINPALINAGMVWHTGQVFALSRVKEYLRSEAREILIKTGHLNTAKRLMKLKRSN